MSTKKFTELSNYPSGSVNAATDILAIVDIASDESKKITVQDLGGAIGGGGIPTGSFMITGSVTDNTLTFTKGDGSTFSLTVDTGSSPIPTLQQVTDQGAITTVPITGSNISASGDIVGNSLSTNEYVYFQGSGSNTYIKGDTGNVDLFLNGAQKINIAANLSFNNFSNIQFTNTNVNLTGNNKLISGSASSTASFGKYIGHPGVISDLTSSYAITASYALNAAGGGGTNISEVYFVTPSGDNGTAEAGNLHKPYSTPEGARAAAAAAGETSGSLIHIFPGEYTVTTILNQDYVGSFYFEPEAIINHTAGTNLFYVTSSVANSERELGVYGHGKFKQNNGGIINMASSSRVYFECDTIIKEGGGSNTIYLQQNADLDLKANLITGSWSNTYFITPRDESYVTAHINNLEYSGSTFCIYSRQGALTSPITTRVANEFTIENFIVKGGYGGLVGGGPSGRGNTFHLDVKNMYVTGSALGGFAVQSAGEVNYSKFVFHNAIMDCSSNSWGFFQDSTTTGESEIIFEGSLKYNGSNNNKPAFQFNGGDITLDMWVECSGSSLGYQINHQGGDLYLNKSLYNDTGGGIRTIGGNLYVDTYKAIVSGSSVLSAGARNVTIYNTFSSNVSASSDITFIGPGTYMSDQTGQIINNDVTITGSLKTSGSVNIDLPSGSAFVVRETDLASNSDDRLVFGYDNGDPALRIISDGTGVASIRLQDEETSPTSGLTLNQTGQFRLGDDNGFKITNDSATEFDLSPIVGSPSSNTNDLGNNTRPWSNLYAYSGIGYSSGAGGGTFNSKRINIAGNNRADGLFNYGQMSLQYSGSTTDTLANSKNHFFGIRVSNDYTPTSIKERLIFSVGKSGSLGINLRQGKTGFGSTYTFYSASAMVHAEAEPNYDLNLFQGDDINGNNVFEVDRTGNVTTTGSLNVSGTGSIAYLEPTETFVNYITFCHNFGSAANTQFYCPWSDSTESPTTATKAAFQVPYSMSLHKLIFSTDNVSTGGQDIIFELVEEANSSGTITTLATSSVTSLAEPGDDATVFTLNASDFNNQVSFSYPNKARLLISSSVAFPTTNDVFVTSVWRQEIKL